MEYDTSPSIPVLRCSGAHPMSITSRNAAESDCRRAQQCAYGVLGQRRRRQSGSSYVVVAGYDGVCGLFWVSRRILIPVGTRESLGEHGV